MTNDRSQAAASICLWLAGSLAVGSVMWPVSKLPLDCYLRSYDLDIIGIGGVAAGFSWLLRLNQRRRVFAIAVVLGILGVADYYHANGPNDPWKLFGIVLLVLAPVLAYVWLIDPSSLVDDITPGNLAPVMKIIRKLLRESQLGQWLSEPLGATVLLLVFSVGVVLFVVVIANVQHLPWTGTCPGSSSR